MADPARTAALALRALLTGAVSCAGLGLAASLAPVPQSWTAWDAAARALRLIGVGALVAAPFAALAILALRERAGRLGAYAGATLLLAALGLLLAR